MKRRKLSTINARGTDQPAFSYKFARVAALSLPQKRSVDGSIEGNHQHCQNVLPIEWEPFLIDEWHKIMHNKVSAITGDAGATGKEVLHSG